MYGVERIVRKYVDNTGITDDGLRFLAKSGAVKKDTYEWDVMRQFMKYCVRELREYWTLFGVLL